MSLEIQLRNVITRVSTDVKANRMLINGNAADNLALATTAKTNLVAALNELKGSLDTVAAIAGSKAAIDDMVTTSTNKTYSVTKIRDLVNTAIASVTNGAPGALDTLKEFADAIGNDSNFAATVATGLANRVRFDAAQTLTATQKSQARANIDAYGSTELGNPEYDLTALFIAGLA